MLILNRSLNEKIVIGDDIEITVTHIRSDRVWLGITAPKDMPVHRLEVAQTIKRDGKRKDERSTS